MKLKNERVIICLWRMGKGHGRAEMKNEKVLFHRTGAVSLLSLNQKADPFFAPFRLVLT